MTRKISYYEEEELLAEAIQYKRDHPEASFRFLERQFKVNKDKICQRFHGRGSRFGQAPANTRLTPEQDKALCWFLDYLDKFGVPLRYKSLISAANHILTISDPDAKPVSKNWPRRWIASHPGYKVRKEKPIEQARQQAMNVIDTRRFYRELEDTSL
jgi:Tc5 transposase DNA-binding domain